MKLGGSHHHHYMKCCHAATEIVKKCGHNEFGIASYAILIRENAIIRINFESIIQWLQFIVRNVISSGGVIWRSQRECLKRAGPIIAKNKGGNTSLVCSRANITAFGQGKQLLED